MHSHDKGHYNEWERGTQNNNVRFLWLMLSVFCLMLGGSVLLLEAVEHFFFVLSFGKSIALVAVLVLAIGGGGLLCLMRPNKLRENGETRLR